MNQTLTTQSDEVPLIYFARALWEAGQPLSVLSRAVLGIGDRALKKRLSSGIDGTVPKEVVNMVTSYNEEFAVPLAQDHPRGGARPHGDPRNYRQRQWHQAGSRNADRGAGDG